MSARFSLHHPLPAYLRPPLHFISPIAPPLKTLSQVLFFRGASSSFVCVQRCAAHLLRPGGHLGIKKCQTIRSTHTHIQPQGRPRAPSTLLAPVNEALLLRPLAVKNCIMHKLFCFHSAWGKHAFALVSPPFPHLLPHSHAYIQPENSFLLRNHRWLCGRK